MGQMGVVVLSTGVQDGMMGGGRLMVTSLLEEMAHQEMQTHSSLQS